jgi:D-xylose transport system substrate-binding protein
MPRSHATIHNGKTEVPAILLKPVVVTKDNIRSTVVADGFQKLQSINQALPEDQKLK